MKFRILDESLFESEDVEMDLRQAQIECQRLNDKYRTRSNSVKWTDIYNSIDELIDDLRKIYIPKERIAPKNTFIGYDYIYSFAYYVQHGWKLSDKQLEQCKRLALEIKKAASISNYKF